MQALLGGGVSANVSRPPSYLGIARIILDSAAAQPHQAPGQDPTNLSKVRREVSVAMMIGWRRHPDDYRAWGRTVSLPWHD
jgi:hypothetical protein